MTSLLKCTRFAAIALAITALGGAATAQNIQIGFGNFGHGKFNIGASLQFGNRGVVREVREREFRRREIYIPAHYEIVSRQIWIEGCFRDVWVEPVYDFRRDACGNLIRVVARAGYWTRVQDAGHYETVRENVWVDGRFECR
ncbi:MAG: hypothetical protein HY286_01785 [Planctomycetes bacterium]|nr:hypothetical protein [Planctomycetota bacterium]